MTIRVCPACKYSESHMLGTKNNFQIRRCDRCQTIYTQDLPTVGQGTNYEELDLDEVMSVPEFIHRRLRNLVHGFSRYRQTNRFLEVGFGSGQVISKAGV